MRETAFRIARKLAEISARADAIAALIRDLGENGESWEVDEIIRKLGDH